MDSLVIPVFLVTQVIRVQEFQVILVTPALVLQVILVGLVFLVIPEFQDSLATQAFLVIADILVNQVTQVQV